MGSNSNTIQKLDEINGYNQTCLQRPLNPKLWPLLKGGRYSEVIYVLKIQMVVVKDML
jgi:hypothetical protein